MVFTIKTPLRGPKICPEQALCDGVPRARQGNHPIGWMIDVQSQDVHQTTLEMPRNAEDQNVMCCIFGGYMWVDLDVWTCLRK